MKVFKSNSGLSFENYVHLIHIDENKYMVVISDHIETYALGQIIEFDQYEINELVETELSIKDSPLYNPLFEHYIQQISNKVEEFKQENNNTSVANKTH